MTIAIDGPVGAGKSTVARLVAERLGLHYVDTGALYRAIAWFLTKRNTEEDNGRIAEALNDLTIRVGYSEGVQHVYVNDEDVSDRIRTPEISQAASRAAVYPAVRDKLLSLQRDIAKEHEVVMDGRDIGTVVLPDADLKIYITASVSERAYRRAKEMEEKGEGPVDLAWMEKEVRERDERDMQRKISPLRQAEDAVLVDTTGVGIDEVVKRICRLAGKE